MGISDSDWSVFMGHIHAMLEDFQVPKAERDEVVALIEGAKQDMVEAA
jgi:hemoglobin